MKRILLFLLALALAFQLCGCGQTEPTWQDQYDAGISALSEGNYEEAIQDFTAAIQLDPTAAEGYLGLADVYLAMEDYDAALDALTQGEGTMDTTGHESGIAQVYASCAQHAYDQGDYEGAIQLWTTAIDWDANDSYQEGIDRANDALTTPQTTETLLSSTWCALCGRNLLYQFQEDGTGKVLSTDGVAEISFTYSVTGDTVSIQESSQSYTWVYSQDKDWFLWDISGLDMVGTDQADVDEEGNLVVAAISEADVQKTLSYSSAAKSNKTDSSTSSSGTDTTGSLTGASSPLRESLMSQIVAHYTSLWNPSGTYACFDSDILETDSTYTFVLRYQISDAEAQEILDRGGIPAANKYVTAVYVDKSTGKVTDEFTDESWTINLS